MINGTKLTRENNSLITSHITLHIICINFQVVFFENNFREFGTPNAVCEEIIRLHIFIESRQEYFQNGAHLHTKMRQSVLLFILTSLDVQFISRNMIFFSSQTHFFQKNWRLPSLLSIFELPVK